MMLNAQLAHTDDPATSHIAAEALDTDATSQMKAAILYLLDVRPVPVHQLTGDYFALRELKQWPAAKPDSVAKRLSELVKAGRVVDTGMRVPGLYGRPVAVWAVSK